MFNDNGSFLLALFEFFLFFLVHVPLLGPGRHLPE